MKQSIQKQRIRIIVFWLAFIAAANVLFFCVEQRLCYEEAAGELLAQAEIAAGQIPALAENDYCSEVGFVKMQIAKAKALAFGLEDYESIDEARPFLDDFSQAACIDGLTILDRSGAVLYRSGSEFEIDYTPESLAHALDQETFRDNESLLDYSDEYIDLFFPRTITPMRHGRSPGAQKNSGSFC